MKRTRDIGLQDVIVAIQDTYLVDVVEHPHEERYPNQHIYLVAYHNHVYAVASVRNDETNEVFLKTIFPGRRYTRLDLRMP